MNQLIRPIQLMSTKRISNYVGVILILLLNIPKIAKA